MNTSDPLETETVTRELEDGQAIAVRTVSDRHGSATVLSGRVELCDAENSWIATIEPGRKWSWWRDKHKPLVFDDTRRLHNRDYGPPQDVRYGYKDSYDITPGLSPQDDGTVELIVPGPVTTATLRVKYYAPDRYGVVTALVCGPIVDPEMLLPDTDIAACTKCSVAIDCTWFEQWELFEYADKCEGELWCWDCIKRADGDK